MTAIVTKSPCTSVRRHCSSISNKQTETPDGALGTSVWGPNIVARPHRGLGRCRLVIDSRRRSLSRTNSLASRLDHVSTTLAVAMSVPIPLGPLSLSLIPAVARTHRRHGAVLTAMPKCRKDRPCRSSHVSLPKWVVLVLTRDPEKVIFIDSMAPTRYENHKRTARRPKHPWPALQDAPSCWAHAGPTHARNWYWNRHGRSSPMDPRWTRGLGVPRSSPRLRLGRQWGRRPRPLRCPPPRPLPR